MKVLQINTVCGTGSTGRIVTDLYKVLEEQGHKCLVAYGRGDAPSNIKSFKIGSKFGVYLHALLSRVTDKQGFYSKVATRKLIRKMKEYDPDIIHLHNLHGYYINIEILFNYLATANKKVVWTLHDCWAFTGHCAHFDYIGCNKWENECFGCIQKKQYPKSLLIDNSKNNFCHKKQLFTSIKNLTIITPSKWLNKIVKNSFLRCYNVKTIYNGINLDTFKPTKTNFRENNNLVGKFVILGVSNIWTDRKGYADFIQLAKILSNEYIFIMVGLNNNQLKEIPSNIIGFNRINNLHELAGIYSAADIYINTSVEETLGMTTIEAVACGTPVIVYNATAIPEVINDKCGIIVEKNNVYQLANVVKDLKGGNIKFDSNECINKAMEYDKENMLDNYLFESLKV